jgi:hypothetical protein
MLDLGGTDAPDPFKHAPPLRESVIVFAVFGEEEEPI